MINHSHQSFPVNVCLSHLMREPQQFFLVMLLAIQSQRLGGTSAANSFLAKILALLFWEMEHCRLAALGSQMVACTGVLLPMMQALMNKRWSSLSDLQVNLERKQTCGRVMVSISSCSNKLSTTKAIMYEDDVSATPKLRKQESTFGIHAVGIDQFPDFVAAMHENQNIGFSEEFKVVNCWFSFHVSVVNCVCLDSWLCRL